MARVKVGIIGAGTTTEWAVLPTLLGPDATTPPDQGAWWSRRPVSTSDIRYQAPAQPDIVALADSDRAQVERVAATARIPGVFTDWRIMLRDVKPDALLCLAPPEETGEVVAAAAKAGVANMWIDAPPAFSADATLQLAKRLHGTRLRLWCARPLRQAAAHRAARQVLHHGQIGPVTALSLRWGAPFIGAPHDKTRSTSNDLAQWLSVVSALDLLLALSSSPNSDTAVPVQVMANGQSGNVNLWLRLASGATATVLFAGADSWSRPMPWLEICGTEGRSIVCEAGRRMAHYIPREAARILEPPGMSTHVTAANVAGMAEDLKAFLTSCVEDAPPAVSAANDLALLSTARSLQLCEAAALSIEQGRSVELEMLRVDAPKPGKSESGDTKASAAIPMTLPL